MQLTKPSNFDTNLASPISNWLEPLDRRDFVKFYKEQREEFDAVDVNKRALAKFAPMVDGLPFDFSGLPCGRVLTFDIECYPNYFLCTFYDPNTGEFWEYEKFNDENHLNAGAILLTLTHNEIITFNGKGYDMRIVEPAILSGASNSELKQVSDNIIVRKKKSQYRMTLKSNHVDIAPVLPLQAAMKMYGCRAAFPELEELPLPPETVLTFEEKEAVRLYCRKDVRLTWYLAEQIRGQLDLRVELSEKYDIDLRSMSDPEIAEALISQYLTKEGVKVRKRTKPVLPFAYRVPDWVEFKSPEFQQALENVKAARFVTDKDGYVVMPKELEVAFGFDGDFYQFGIGGLHSQEANRITIAQDDEEFGEFDVGSMYPSIIIEQELFPFHLSPVFLAVYSGIKDERMIAKKTDPLKAQTYKIILNGSYGKFGSKYSFLYSPELLIQTTITGQLSLLMLVERMTEAGGKVVSANTDGVNVLYKKKDRDAIFAVKKWWEESTTYELEFTQYDATYNRDVNNYIAVKTGGGVKGKGTYGDPTLSKNPQTPIINDAILGLLVDGVSMEDTIKACKDPFRFTSCQKVKGGAVKDGEPVGEIARWYYSTKTETPLNYAKNGNKVPKSVGAMPAMDLPEDLWDDLDFGWYMGEAQKKLNVFIHR